MLCMPRLTYKQFIQMPRHQQTEAYFRHESNAVTHKRKGVTSTGPGYVAQADFMNDWQRAFENFAHRLPLR